MSRSTTEAFTVTMALHVAVAALLVVFSLLAQWWEEEPPVVLELVDLSGAMPLSAPSDVPAREPVPEPLPEPPPAEPLEPLAVSEFDPVRPPPLVPEPLPEPEPEREPQPKPKPPPPRQVTYDQHVRQHGEPEVTPARTPRPRNRPEVPQIRTDDLRQQLSQALSTPTLQNAAAYSQAERSELEAYVAGIQQRLQAVFKPVGEPGLAATVEFTVAPDGTFRDFRVVQSSGDSAFDRAALAAFRQARRYRPTPDGKTYTWRIVFRSVE